MYGICFQVQRYSIHDGPGIRTTVFLKGCPLSCVWCHNPESQTKMPSRMWDAGKCLRCDACSNACPTGALEREEGGAFAHDPSFCGGCRKCVDVCPTGAIDISGRWVLAEDLAASALRDETFFDESGGGVTVSGGEPLSQIGFLSELLTILKARGIHTAIDTSGYADKSAIEKALPLTDLFLYDLKCADDDRHRAFTGVSNKPILDNLRYLAQKGANIVGRMPIVPGLNDDEGLVKDGLTVFADAGVQTVHLIPYHRAGTYKYERLGREYTLTDTLVPDENRMRRLAALADDMPLTVRIGG